jgi:hypothetical protein
MIRASDGIREERGDGKILLISLPVDETFDEGVSLEREVLVIVVIKTTRCFFRHLVSRPSILFCSR